MTEDEKTQNFNADALKKLAEEQENAKKMFAEQKKKDDEAASEIARNRTKSAGGKIK